MAEVSTIGLDIAKQAFQAHGADASRRVVFRKKIARTKLIEFFGLVRKQPNRLAAGATLLDSLRFCSAV